MEPIEFGQIILLSSLVVNLLVKKTFRIFISLRRKNILLIDIRIIPSSESFCQNQIHFI